MQAVAEAFSQCIDILPQKLISTIEEETEYIQAAGAAVPASQSWQQRAEETQHKKCCPGREQAEAMQIGTAYLFAWRNNPERGQGNSYRGSRSCCGEASCLSFLRVCVRVLLPGNWLEICRRLALPESQ